MKKKISKKISKNAKVKKSKPKSPATTASPVSQKQNVPLMPFIILGLLFVLAIVIVTNYSSGLSEETKQLLDVEVREYQGENLSSISDFRENSIKGPQQVDITSYSLKVAGLVENEQNLLYDDVISLQNYEKVVTLNCVEGWSAKILWKGVLLKDIIDKAKVNPEANTIIFHAYDGYTSSLPLDYVISNNILLAYNMNGVTIPPERGFPFTVVAESKWGYKWVKWVTEIELSNDPNYQGFWESRGYNNNGDLNGSKWD